MNNYGDDKKSAVQAKFDAQKIAFGPIMFQAARSMRTLGIFENLHKERKNGMLIKEVADSCNLSVYGAKVLLEAGISLDMVYVREDRFYLTKTGWFFLNDPLTIANTDFVHDVNYKGFYALDKSIETGKPEGLKEFGDWTTVYEALSQLPPKVQDSWFAFDHYYSDEAFPEVLPILFENSPGKVLDVGGNTGKFSMSAARFNPNVQMTILDLPGQLEKAQVEIDSKGLTDRIELIPINLLDHSIAYPTGYDIVWMSQFLDCFSKIDIIELLRKAAKAINEEGEIYILETLWDRQKYPASTYSLHATSLYFTCVANGCSQMYHTDDMIEVIDAAGLILDKTWDNIGIGHTLLRCKLKK
jgi:ubiquinone/menaquinone biosynthesis C-methylase UbiE